MARYNIRTKIKRRYYGDREIIRRYYGEVLVFEKTT